MKPIQSCLSLLMSFLLICASSELVGCGGKDATTPTPALQQASSASSDQTPPANGDQTPPANPDQAQMQLPQVSLSADGLDELLMPIALYPDPVLAVLLQATADPQEVMDGGNWLALDQNQSLKEAALDDASQKAGFTPVMQALLHYPTVVDLMCQKFDWTKQLGAAYQEDPKAVLASVQRLRAQAVDSGALKSSPQMAVNVTQDQGNEVVELKPTDPKVVYVPQYDPDQVFNSAPAPASNTTVVQQQSSGVSTQSAVLIGLLSFGAGIAIGRAISNNNYYYPRWGYGGVWYGPRPYYPPPYRPVYYPGWGPAYGYNRPVHYSTTNIYINNTTYYNRFNNNNNLNPSYKPRPVPYNNNPNSVYARSMGNSPAAKQGVVYRPPAGNGQNNNNWKGQTAYQGKPSGNNGSVSARPAPNTSNPQTRPAGGAAGNNQGATTRPSGGSSVNNGRGQAGYQGGNKGASTQPSRPSNGTNPATKPATGAQPTTRPTQPSTQPGTQPATRPGTKPSTQPSTQPATRPGTKPSTQPAKPTQPSTRPSTQPSTQPSGRPSTQPAKPSTQPSTRPNTQAAKPKTQPATRPNTQATKPSSSQPGSRPNTQSTNPPGQ